MHQKQYSPHRKHMGKSLRVSLARIRQVFILLAFLCSLVGMNPIPVNAASTGLICEDFDSGWTDGAKIDNTNWYSNNGPTIDQGEGVASSWGISNSGNIFIWKTESFSWADPTLTSAVFQMDFETSSTGQFDDDRVGWQTTNTNISSDYIFGVQLDNAGGHQRIEGYWDHVYGTNDDDGRPEIASLDGLLTANTWYRLTAEFTKLTDTSAKIDAEIWSLNASGDPVSRIAGGTIADTSALGSTSPNASPAPEYFTTATLYPAFKNHNGLVANADNACYEVKAGAPLPQYDLTVSTTGTGTVSLDPAGGTYTEGTSVELTAEPGLGWTFSGWSGGVTGTDNPVSVTMDSDKTVTATFTQVPPVALTVSTVGNGTVVLDPAGGSYPVGTIVELTADPADGWSFSGWSGGLSGSANPGSITMDVAKSVTATFVEIPPPSAGICEDFETGFTTGQVVGAHAEWFDSGAGSVVTSGNGLAGSIGLAPGSSIFTWTQYPFDWNDPAFASITFNMDYQTNASGQFDDDRMGWMTTDANADSTHFFGVQLDHTDGGIVTYWRNAAGTRIQTPIVDLASLSASTWYRLETTISKLTDTSARIDVSLVQLNTSGNPTGTAYTGTLNDTSVWPDGAPALDYFTAASMWPAYKNHSALTGAADNVCFDIASGRFAFVVSTDWHTSDTYPNGGISAKAAQIANWVDNPTANMPAPEFMVITGDLPRYWQTEEIINNEIGDDFLWYPVIGNHEMDDMTDFNTIRDTVVPSLPNIVNHGPTGSTNTTYSFDYENSHFVVINPFWDGASDDSTAGGDIPAALNTWVNADLATNADVHNFVFIHTPPFPKYRHVGEDLDANPANRNAFVSTLDANGVEAVFSGHTHYYEHDTYVDYPLLGGVHQVTNGSLRDGGVPVTVTYVLVEGNTTTYKVYSWNGSAFSLHDQWVVGGGLPSTPPAAPTALSAAAVTYAHINLAWTDNADNEASFEIQRSTTGSGGLFSTLATVPADTESYGDYGLSELSEYCYRARAINAAGESTYTSVACATTPERPAFVGVCEDFESGFAGAVVGAHADWYDGGSGPLATTGVGLVSSVGLAPAANIFTWTAQPFSWDDPAFQSANFEMDFQTNASGQFDDDRLGWMTANSNVDSANFFGVQLDHTDGGIVTYWRDSSDTRIQTPIVPLSTLSANTWYRLRAEITKLTDTSATIDVSLVRLDASGNPTGVPYAGTVPDTSLWAGGAPDTSYFTAATMWPAYKNHNAIVGAADNACYEVLSGLNTIITAKPNNPTNSTEASFSFSSTKPGSTFECKLDAGSFVACSSPKTYSGLLNGEHTFQVRAIDTEGPDPTPASYTWIVNTSLPSDLVGYWKLDEGTGIEASDSSGYDNDGTVHGPTWASGQSNGALRFDGSDDYVQVPASTTLNLDSNRVTFAAWVNGDTLTSGGWEPIMARSNANLSWFDWQIYATDGWSSGFPTCRIDWDRDGINDVDEVVQDTVALQTGAWNHIACTYDGSAIRLYINGVLRDVTSKAGGTIPNSGRDIWFGSNESWGSSFDGMLDEIYIYNRALSEAEIQLLVNPPTCYGLTLSHTGSGSNPVAAPANSAGCPAGSYVAGATINLSGAAPATGWHINGWTGTNNNASTASTNTVTMPGNAHAASVVYVQNEYTLTVQTTGSGTVSLDPEQATYHYGDSVELTAAPLAGWSFAGWSGALSGLTNPAAIVMDGNKTVMATFAAVPPTCYGLSLSHSGQGSNPAATPANSSGCPTGEYVAGEVVSLSGAVPVTGWGISGWTGTNDNSSKASTNTVTMPARAHTASVSYEEVIPPVVASVTRASGNPTSAASVDFTVTFSEAVTGVDKSDFSLASSGVTGPSITLVTGSGAIWTVKVNTGTGNGTIRLNVLDNNSIVDAGSNPLAGGFATGEAYTVITTATFDDVPTSYWAWRHVESIYLAGFTGGCGTSPLIYCTDDAVTRAQMAVFLEKGVHGSAFGAPVVPISFNDTSGHWAQYWIEALKSDGITGGCGTGIYCPDAAVTRAQMAVFLLKSKYGAGYTPPAMGASTGFSDVATTHWAAAWIKQLAAEGITGGCGNDNYCPESPVTRAQMAVFLQKTFNLPMP